MTASPAPEPTGDVTRLLQAVATGDRQAEAALATLVYAELRRLAAGRLVGESERHSSGPTALVHEAWLRLGVPDATFADRAHFFGAAARAMRRVLVDRHRYRHGQRRDRQRESPQLLDEIAASAGLPEIDLLALDEALTDLERIDARMVEIVQLRFFSGLSVSDTARALGTSERTVKREWNVARAWLYRRLEPDAGR